MADPSPECQKRITMLEKNVREAQAKNGRTLLDEITDDIWNNRNQGDYKIVASHVGNDKGKLREWVKNPFIVISMKNRIIDGAIESLSRSNQATFENKATIKYSDREYRSEHVQDLKAYAKALYDVWLQGKINTQPYIDYATAELTALQQASNGAVKTTRGQAQSAQPGC